MPQDWDFPYFDGGMEIKLPGLNTGNFHFHLPGGDIHITGKWFNYGIIFIVMILDLNMWKNQIFYEPYVYGQYTDDQHYIFTVSDRDFLANATKKTLSYAWRWTHVNPMTNKTYGTQDHKMNSRYVGFPLSAKGTAFIPSLFAFAMFGILVKYFSKGGPTAKVAPVEEKGDADGTHESKNDDVGAAGESPSSQCFSGSRQSLSSYKTEVAVSKPKNFQSFLSMESSRGDRNSSRDQLDSSRDKLNSSRDFFESSDGNLNSSRDELGSSRENLEGSRDDLRNSAESVGAVHNADLKQSTTSYPAWSTETPVVALPPKERIRRDSSAKKDTQLCQSSTDEHHNETMVQELVQELSFLNLDEGENESKESKPPEENASPVNDGNDRALSFGDFFRRDTSASLGSQSQMSVVTPDDEDERLHAQPPTAEKINFLQVPKAK